MDLSEILKKLSEAFSPYECVVEDWDYKERIKFRIYDEKRNPIITVPELLVQDVDTEDKLNNVIDHYKDIIQNKGFSF